MSNGRESLLTIETPEGVEFSYDLATPVTRSLAWIVDAAAIAVISKGVSQVCQWLGVLNQDWANAVSVILYFLISVGYGITLEWR
jgi:hypothetical protein